MGLKHTRCFKRREGKSCARGGRACPPVFGMKLASPASRTTPLSTFTPFYIAAMAHVCSSSRKKNTYPPILSISFSLLTHNMAAKSFIPDWSRDHIADTSMYLSIFRCCMTNSESVAQYGSVCRISQTGVHKHLAKGKDRLSKLMGPISQAMRSYIFFVVLRADGYQKRGKTKVYPSIAHDGTDLYAQDTSGFPNMVISKQVVPMSWILSPLYEVFLARLVQFVIDKLAQAKGVKPLEIDEPSPVTVLLRGWCNLFN